MIDGRVVTSKPEILEAISRKTFLEICFELNIPSEATKINKHDFMKAPELFTTITTGIPVPVKRVNAYFGNDAISLTIAKSIYS